jgi:glutamine synthetase
MKYLLEYIWIDGTGNLRSKNRIMDFMSPPTLRTLPVWNFDGSSTQQATTENSERFLKPVHVATNPFFPLPNTSITKKYSSWLVLCAVYDDLKCTAPSLYNHYHAAAQVLTKYGDTYPWFGFEQEFFLRNKKQHQEKNNNQPQGPLDYCGVGGGIAHRELMTAFTTNCLEAGVRLYGTNAEVAPDQWEFQVGTICGLDAAHELWLARYILLRTAEMYETQVSFEPKPRPDMNGSGCHANFSNIYTRDGKDGVGVTNMFLMMKNFAATHAKHIAHYGDNSRRLTGHHETSQLDTFTHSVGGRNTSVRIGHQVIETGHGYFEDRRPASNCDPYLVCALLVESSECEILSHGCWQQN